MLRFRPLLPQDQAFLWDALHVALWDPPPAPLRPRGILAHPDVRIYAESWGRKGDVGVVALAGQDDLAGARRGCGSSRAARDSPTWTTALRSWASRSGRRGLAVDVQVAG